MAIDTSNKPEANPELRDFAVSVLGPRIEIEDRSRSFGRQSVTWKITTSEGATFYIKQHESRSLFETELAIYNEWIPQLFAQSSWSFPDLVAHSDELGALVTTGLPGEIVDETDLSTDELLVVHREAGRLAALIHGLDVDASILGPPRDYGPETWDEYIPPATPYLDAETLRWVEVVASDERNFEGLELVPTHCDLSPRNWLIDRSGGRISMGVIDWERARAGYWLEDAQRLVYDYWAKGPGLRDAFFEGYGRQPDEREERQMDVICLANAVGTVSWAEERGDMKFARFAHSVIKTLRSRLG